MSQAFVLNTVLLHFLEENMPKKETKYGKAWGMMCSTQLDHRAHPLNLTF